MKNQFERNITVPFKKMIAATAALLMIGSATALGQGWNPFHGLHFRETPQIVKAVSYQSPALLAASRNELFVSSNQGKSWKQALHVPGKNSKINEIEIFPDEPKVWYALTTDGLYRSENSGKNWSKIYSAVGDENNNLLCAVHHPFEDDMIYLGTGRGVVVSKNNGNSWTSTFAELARKPVWDIAVDRDNAELFFVAGNEVYRYHVWRDQFRKVFTASASAAENEPEEDDISIEDDISSNVLNPFVRSITISESSEFPIAIGTRRGVFISRDEGETWQRLSTIGLRSIEISDVVYSKKASTLFAATPKGIFQYDPQNQIWREIYEGLTDGESFKLAIQPEPKEILLAATKGGVFYYDITAPVFKPEVELPENLEISKRLLELIEKEPPVGVLHKEAIKYANVSNTKIKRWHMESRLRALVPDLSVGKDLDIDNNIHTDTGSTTVPDLFVQGPDDRGKSTSIDLSWDLGDFVWGTAQTSIDSREKLMVELREDILNEITRIYFERRRAQLEFAMNPPEDPMENINAKLRIEELTANLDALTNGYLSKKLNQLYTRNSGLDQFWQSSFEKNGSEL